MHNKTLQFVTLAQPDFNHQTIVSHNYIEPKELSVLLPAPSRVHKDSIQPDPGTVIVHRLRRSV